MLQTYEWWLRMKSGEENNYNGKHGPVSARLRAWLCTGGKAMAKPRCLLLNAEVSPSLILSRS